MVLARSAIIVLLGFLCSCSGHRVYEDDDQPTVSRKNNNILIVNQIQRHNEDGSYTYGYEGSDGSFKIETKSRSGDVSGKYGYVDDSGKLRTVEYGANRYGFQPSGEGITVPPPTLVESSRAENDDDGDVDSDGDRLPPLRPAVKGPKQQLRKGPVRPVPGDGEFIWRDERPLPNADDGDVDSDGDRLPPLRLKGSKQQLQTGPVRPEPGDGEFVWRDERPLPNTDRDDDRPARGRSAANLKSLSPPPPPASGSFQAGTVDPSSGSYQMDFRVGGWKQTGGDSYRTVDGYRAVQETAEQPEELTRRDSGAKGSPGATASLRSINYRPAPLQQLQTEGVLDRLVKQYPLPDSGSSGSSTFSFRS